MNAFVRASEVEAASWEILRPFIETHCHDGRFVRTAKGPLAKELQKSCGDVLYNSRDGSVWGVEIKAERKHTGNLFLERWSNRSRFTPGWLETLGCDLLLYHFLDADILYGLNFKNLRKWFYFCEHKETPRASLYGMAAQGAYEQKNDTWGYLVPVSDLPGGVLIGTWTPLAMSSQQIPKWASTGACSHGDQGISSTKP